MIVVYPRTDDTFRIGDDGLGHISARLTRAEAEELVAKLGAALADPIGRRVIFDGKLAGVVVGREGLRLRVQFDGEDHAANIDPRAVKFVDP